MIMDGMRGVRACVCTSFFKQRECELGGGGWRGNPSEKERESEGFFCFPDDDDDYDDDDYVGLDEKMEEEEEEVKKVMG